MKLIKYLQSEPAIFLVFSIIIVCICIIGMVIFILLKLESEKKVTKAALELSKITNSIRAGLVHFVLEDKCKILYASKGFYELLGYSKKEVRDSNKMSLFDFFHPKDMEHFQNSREQLRGNSFKLEVRLLTKQDKILYALINGNSSKEREGKHIISAVIVDITEQKQMQEMLLLEGERYRIASDLSNDVLFEYHIKSDEIIYTEKYQDLFGRNPAIQNFGKNCELRREFIHPDDWGIYLEFCNELIMGKKLIEAVFRMKDRMNDYIWCQAMGKTIYDDDEVPIRIIGKIVNVDTQKRELEALEYKATRDPLTGVYNKEITIKKIDKYINAHKKDSHTLMIIDFDDFKKVNDSYGHLIGDRVLNFVISRIKNVFTEGEIIGRIGGDEFIVFSGNMGGKEELIKKADSIIKTLDTEYVDGDLRIPISGSVGIATYPADGIHYEQLIQCADKALYRVKEQGKKNYMLYTTAI